MSSDYDKKQLAHMLKVEHECLHLARDEHDEQFRRCAAVINEARAEIVTLRTELQDARAVIHEIVERARSIAPLVYAYDAASEHLREPK